MMFDESFQFTHDHACLQFTHCSLSEIEKSGIKI